MATFRGLFRLINPPLRGSQINESAIAIHVVFCLLSATEVRRLKNPIFLQLPVSSAVVLELHPRVLHTTALFRTIPFAPLFQLKLALSLLYLLFNVKATREILKRLALVGGTFPNKPRISFQKWSRKDAGPLCYHCNSRPTASKPAGRAVDKGNYRTPPPPPARHPSATYSSHGKVPSIKSPDLPDAEFAF